MFCKGWILHGAFILKLKCAILFLCLLHSQFFVIPAVEIFKTLKVMTGMILSLKLSIVVVISSIVVCAINFLVYRKDVKDTFLMMKNILKKEK